MVGDRKLVGVEHFSFSYTKLLHDKDSYLLELD